MRSLLRGTALVGLVVVAIALGGCEEGLMSGPPLDSRCPYHVGLAPGGSGTIEDTMLLDRVSSAGILCATGTNQVSQDALDRVSRASTLMLQNNPAVARRLAPGLASDLPYTAGDFPRNFGEIIVLYGENERPCDAVPKIYQENMRCEEVRLFAIGWYSSPIILCPENNLSTCVHEIAHAVYFSLAYADWQYEVNEREPVIERFQAHDVSALWSGYALEDDNEFFAEMTEMYFCVPGGKTLPMKHCARELQAYDPWTYAVLHAIYRGATDLRQY